jgi:hypothetical protein
MIDKSVKSQHLCKSVIQTINDIVKAHGGDLEIETSINRGTKFIIKLIT